MGVRSLGNALASFRNKFGTTGIEANAISPAIPISASGGNIDGATPGNGFTYHVFTSPGTFTVSSGPADGADVEYLVVAGGGSGAYDRGSGGGAGGLRCNSSTCPAPRRTPSLSLNPGPYSITVGDGGSTHNGYGAMSPPVAGQPSSIASTVVASGGGGTSPTASEGDGGSGKGGGSGGQNGRGDTVASPDGLSPTVQGFDGGGGSPPVPSGTGAAGGGGAGGAGGASSPPSSGTAGVGGAGLAIPAFAGPLFPTMPTPWKNAVGPTGVYAGGGGGGGSQDNQGPPNGGPAHPGGGGGGAGGSGSGDGAAAVANTGSGGGGGGNLPQGDGGAGGKGIVIIRYQT